MSDDLLADSLQRLLQAHCPPQQVRAIEGGATAGVLWRKIQESGFADALVAEAHGGAGLGLADVFPLLLACGSHALPVPLAYTMVARALLADAGLDAPPGPISLGIAATDAQGCITCHRVDWGLVAEWILVDIGKESVLLAVADAERTPSGTHGSLVAGLRWPALPPGALHLPRVGDLNCAAAALLAAQMAGAMQAILSGTVSYANERAQFGKLIGKFQATQQQLSVMAEQVFAARMAAELGCRSGGQGLACLPAPLHAALAKARCSEAVAAVASIAHAVHGAIGITAEFDLQLLTRRLHEWRLAAGAEAYWQQRIGSALLTQEVSMLEFVRNELFAAGA